jgi:type VI secretion system protein ImpG
MDRVFLEYYEEELMHIRQLAAEFADMHPTVARNLSLDTVPCPDPYVERLLDGVAFLAARTRQKVDGERSRFARGVLDLLYPDLVSPTPATGMAVLKPGQQLQTMNEGHLVSRGARLLSGLMPGLSTRATYTTAQDVHLWPLEVASVRYFQDRSAIASAGLQAPAGSVVESALSLSLARVGKGNLNELTVDALNLCFAGRSKSWQLFDAFFGACVATAARPEGGSGALRQLALPEMVGIADTEALMPRTRPTFEGYRLLREYFMMPERFHYVRVGGLQPVVRRSATRIEIVFFFRRHAPELADVSAADFELFVTPIINLFERECNVIELDGRRTRQAVYADRTRPRDFEIFRMLRVEDADREGPEAAIPELFGLGQNRGSGWVYSTERRPRRATEDERRQGVTRASYMGDDLFIAISRPPGRAPSFPLKRIDIVALCTNRDLPILDDTPTLTLDGGDPIESVRLIGAIRAPQRSMAPALPSSAEGESRADEIAWRVVSQLSLNFLSLAADGRGADPLHVMLDLYADRGDPGLARHVRSIARVASRPVIERLPIDGPMCFGRGIEVTLDIDQSVLTGHSALLLSALLSKLFARHAGINGFVRTRSRLLQKQEEVSWPIMPGNRHLI